MFPSHSNAIGQSGAAGHRADDAVRADTAAAAPEARQL